MAGPNKNYWSDPKLKLYYNSNADHSIDDNGAKTYNKKANVPGTYVTDMQSDLIAAGYLDGKADGDFGAKTHRAVVLFQRRAKTKYRLSGGKAADVTAVTYTGLTDGICEAKTAAELRLWIGSKLKAPLGRFSIVAIPGGKLRSDIAPKWASAVSAVKAAGGTLATPYGDSTRGVSFRKKTGGNSLTSLHYTGRAIDINQKLGDPKGKRYYAMKETVGSNVYWKILCSTDKQKGGQGTKYESTKLKPLKYYDFGSKKEVTLPTKYYIDLTAMLKAKGFKRIKAHSNWKTNYKGTEWWHFHYDGDLQETFQGEMELIGYDDKTMQAKGWPVAQLDRKPG